ncbi:MAG: DUF1501 domain-containing protein, partial [Planctomycetota bacterium]
MRRTPQRSTEIALQYMQSESRRQFLYGSAAGLGAAWLAMQGRSLANAPSINIPATAKAKRVIYLHMVGAPSQLELFNYRPELEQLTGKPCPQSFLEGKRFAFINGVPNMLGPQFPFAQHGESGIWMSDRLPHLAKVADELCVIQTMQTDQFNHGPAQLMVHTGTAQMGSPAIGSWVTYGLGSENEDLPGFIVLLSGGRLPRVGKALWSGGFLPSVYQGVQCRGQGEPVLNLANPAGVSRSQRRHELDAIAKLNQHAHQQHGDAETLTRISQYEMAFRMQTAAPEAMDLNTETKETLDAYDAKPGKASFANNCLLARRLVERDVRFVQLYDWGWDAHGAAKGEALNHGFKDKCKSVDKPIAALISDLRERGLLEDTLVVWGGEFGRT